jgi:Cof subfamily protein (haloacid dehalogenase superfamily)
VPNFKIAFFDIDWTLYDHQNKRWTPSSLTALKTLQKKGLKLVLCTARPFHSFEKFGALDLGIRWDGYIASAGGIVYANRHYLRKTLMNPTIVRRFIAACKHDHLAMELVETKQRYLATPVTADALSFYQSFSEVEPPYKKYHGEQVVGIAWFSQASYDEKYRQAFPELLLERYFPTAVDVMSEPHEKGDGISLVLRELGYSKDEAIAFGDDTQDLSMVPEVGTFVCMGQGKEALKQKATYVTSPVWDDGIEKALRHFSLL